MVSLKNSTRKTFKRRINTSSIQSLSENRGGENTVQFIYEVNITLIPKTDIDNTIKERRKGKRKEGNHEQIPFINIDTKVLNIIVANKIHQYKERLYIK